MIAIFLAAAVFGISLIESARARRRRRLRPVLVDDTARWRRVTGSL